MNNVRFNLRQNKNKDSQIQFVYRLGGDKNKLVISTGLHVPKHLWSVKQMRISIKFPNSNLYNAILGDWENAANTVIKKYALLNQTPSKEVFRNEVKAIMSGNITQKTKVETFASYFEDFIEIKKCSQVAKTTITQYQNALNWLYKYSRERCKGRVLEFKDINENFFFDFIAFAKKEIQDNTINKLIRRFRTVLTHAEKNGIEINKNYKNEGCQVPYVKQPKIYLNKTEIEQIKAYTLEYKSKLDKVRDRLIIGLRTGLRFSDFSRIDKDFVTTLNGKPIIEIQQQKVKGEVVRIPLASEVVDILDKYNGFPPKISEQKFNDYLKELCKLTGIDTRISRIENGKQVFYKKWELVSSHICRRSFATLAFTDGMSPEIARKFTGHSTVKQYMEYICLDEEERLNSVLDSKFFQ